MEYEEGYVYKLMDKGGPTDVREPYFKEAVDEMMRARVLCAKANALLPDDPAYASYLEELFGTKIGKTKTLASPFGFGKSWWKLRQDVLLEKVNDTWIIKQSKASSY